MSKGLFITGTGTDVGKTYVTASLVKALREGGIDCGYYKAAISGADNIKTSDAGYVNNAAQINQQEDTLVSYIYKTAVSPHLAANMEGNLVCLEKVKSDYTKVCDKYDYIAVEGSGGIVCPLRHDESQTIMLTDIVKLLDIPVLIIADSGLGTINATVLTIEYLKKEHIPICGVILNRFDGSQMQLDNKYMIELLTGIKVIGTVSENSRNLGIEAEDIAKLFA